VKIIGDNKKVGKNGGVQGDGNQMGIGTIRLKKCPKNGEIYRRRFETGGKQHSRTQFCHPINVQIANFFCHFSFNQNQKKI
jgi:hypothetical protein